MTPEQQRIAIAEACGWQDSSGQGLYWNDKEHRALIAPGGALHRIRKAANLCCEPDKQLLPDYLNDLNAMHEAEKIIPVISWDIYERNLAHCISATASQRAEAFLRTIGKLT